MGERPTNDEVRSVWDENAAWWDPRMASADSWQQTLVFPTVELLLELQPGEVVLEIACGNGLLAQRMAEAGAHVVAFDFSEEQLGRARARATHPDVELQVADATDAAALGSFGEARFDAAVASMALMDISEIEPLAGALPRLLKPSGRFVFAVSHPAFNNLSSVMTIERRTVDGEFVEEHAVRVSRYAGLQVGRGVGIVGQPAPHWYFDRSISDLLRPFLAAGLALDALEEPVFDEETAARFDERALWRDIPPILAARLRNSY